MNTLTKILIVLLTTSSLFLCGLVATYVANADNYKQLHDQKNSQLIAAQAKESEVTRQADEKARQAEQVQEALKSQISSLGIRIGQLEAALTNAEREKAQLIQRVDGFAAEVKAFKQTNDNQGKFLETTVANWKAAEAGLLKEQSQHKETADALEQQMVVVSALEQENRRLKEERVDLQSRLNKLLGQYGKVVTVPEPVTPVTAQAKAAEPETKEISLKGQVTEVDLKNSMAEISIGAAQGVKKGMKFLVTRGDQFICNILISDVESDKAVGDLSLVQETPKAGDEASTNL